MDWKLFEEVRRRLKNESGMRYPTGATNRIVLANPTPYHTGMSSLGFQTVYRLFNEKPGIACERTFLPDDPNRYRASRTPLFSYETETPVHDFEIVAISIAYELEISGLLEVLDLSGIPLKREERAAQHPLVLAGGPLTFSNPLPLSPFVDVMILGEAEQAIPQLVAQLEASGRSRVQQLEALSRLPGFYVPALHGERLPDILAVSPEFLPATSVLTTPETELSDMFLIEASRGCSRGCMFCVMRRSPGSGMRVVPRERILSLIPAETSRVGLVGAAVSDHPDLEALVEAIVAKGHGIGLSSLRADKMTPELVRLFRQAGYRQLTVASDGASERIRKQLARRIEESHILNAAQLSAAAGMSAMKVYVMLGAPGETDDDLQELICFTRELAGVIPIVLGVSFFVAKRNTPLDGSPFEDIRVLGDRLKRLKSETGPRVEVRPASAKWAWIEYRLAQGGWAEGLAALEAWRKGGSFAAWRRALLEAGMPQTKSGARAHRTSRA